MNYARETARLLLEIEAVRLAPQQPFTWASGMLSPIYCDNRVGLSYPAVRTFLKKALASLAPDFGDFDVVAGVATAGIPQGVLVADLLDKPFVYVRSTAKDHGRRNQIEGTVTAGQKVLVIEDLISTGGSSLVAVDALQAAGCEVVGVLAIFQYGFPEATEAFAARHLPLRTLSNYDTLVQTAVEHGYIAEGDLRTLQEWRVQPQKWGALYA